jgi:hypothetical protein
VVVAALGLDGLDDDGRDVVLVVANARRIWSSERSSAARTSVSTAGVRGSSAWVVDRGQSNFG